jgi:hypothetical protein
VSELQLASGGFHLSEFSFKVRDREHDTYLKEGSQRTAPSGATPNVLPFRAGTMFQKPKALVNALVYVLDEAANP